MSFVAELKRRNVVRATIAYVLIAWVLLQILDFALDVISAPNWIIQVLTLLAVVGLPAVMVFSWVYEMTPEGIKREQMVSPDQSIMPETGRKLDRVIILFLAAALIVVLGREYLLKPAAEDATNPTVAVEAANGEENTNEQNPGAQSPAAPGAPPAPPATGTSAQPASTDKSDDGLISVAVLPFINMSDEAENEYFSDGISEELLNVLVRIEGLRVPSRTSSFTFKGTDKKIAEIGRELNVDHVLEGSVRRAGDRIRVTAQLIDVSNDMHLWSETYTRELDDIFAVQDEISQAIVAALEVTLTGTDRALLAERTTNNVEAYNYYLQGRQLWHRRTVSALEASAEALEKAVALDEDFSRAWAALADAYALIPEYRLSNGKLHDMDQTIGKARDASNRALALDPNSARAYTARGYIRFMYDYDHEGARKDFERALELDPKYATAHQWYGEFLGMQRDIEGALAQFMEAAELDPLAPIMWHVSGWTLSQAGRTEESLRYYERALQIAPDFAVTYSNLELVYFQLGRIEESKKAVDRFFALNDLPQEDLIYFADAARDPIIKQRYIEEQSLVDGGQGAMGTAYALMLLDEPDLAMDNLETAFAAGDPYAVHANRAAVYDELRDTPRFQAYLARMNLWP